MSKNEIRLEQMSAGLSVACAVHCASMPLVATFLPMFGLSFLAHSEFEWLILTLSIGLALYILGRDFKLNHKNFQPLLIAGLGFGVIFTGHLWSELEVIFAILGAVVIVIAYWLNWKLTRQVKVCKC